MCCFITVLLFIGPRAAIIVWYLLEPMRFNAAINSFLMGCLGFIFLPWTTLGWLVAFNAVTGVSGFGWVIVGLGLLADIATYSGGGYGNRNRIRR
ncbi:MAG: hypothetical protein KDI07_19000 [Anaerolineae bacterium]|nr:hypothetical protein [Anaerolineae bacterium]MCB9131207.1 hypothetical protein [Anaerolineales bacterium]MCB0228907.1 hypothetical protein [Anaerolineae bacterium]MCB0240058.1 hypothetical protein [Anaerolineae bacterium]MCB0250669.1 hypothetical protein [Anaerolineae bacterium]